MPATETDTSTLADLRKFLMARTGAGEGDRMFTDRVIGHDEALGAAQRLINSHFGNPNGARASIPADRERDDDLVLCAYIAQRHATDVPWLAYDPLSHVLTVHGHRISGHLLEQLTVSPCGESYRVVSRDDGIITVSHERDSLAAAAPDLLAATRRLLVKFENAMRIAGNGPEVIADATEEFRALIARAETR